MKAVWTGELLVPVSLFGSVANCITDHSRYDSLGWPAHLWFWYSIRCSVARTYHWDGCGMLRRSVYHDGHVYALPPVASPIMPLIGADNIPLGILIVATVIGVPGIY